MSPRSARLVPIFAAVLGLAAMATPPAQAIHLFPLTPVFDPLGHDCAKALSADPGGSDGRFAVAGFNFINEDDRSSTVTIEAGGAVAWTWAADHCHSVTFAAGGGTVGAPGFQPAQPELVRMNGPGSATFTASFEQPGTYLFSCVHHGSVGMRGQVVVT